MSSNNLYDRIKEKFNDKIDGIRSENMEAFCKALPALVEKTRQHIMVKLEFASGYRVNVEEEVGITIKDWMDKQA